MASNKPTTYEDLLTAYASDPEHLADGLMLRPNTMVVHREGDELGIVFDVILYGTRIVTVFPDGSVIIRDGGHTTNTTKNRINDFLIPLGWRLKEVEGAWKVWPEKRGKPVRDYFSGMYVRNNSI